MLFWLPIASEARYWFQLLNEPLVNSTFEQTLSKQKVEIVALRANIHMYEAPCEFPIFDFLI